MLQKLNFVIPNRMSGTGMDSMIEWIGIEGPENMRFEPLCNSPRFLSGYGIALLSTRS